MQRACISLPIAALLLLLLRLGNDATAEAQLLGKIASEVSPSSLARKLKTGASEALQGAEKLGKEAASGAESLGSTVVRDIGEEMFFLVAVPGCQ